MANEIEREGRKRERERKEREDRRETVCSQSPSRMKKKINFFPLCREKKKKKP